MDGHVAELSCTIDSERLQLPMGFFRAAVTGTSGFGLTRYGTNRDKRVARPGLAKPGVVSALRHQPEGTRVTPACFGTFVRIDSFMNLKPCTADHAIALSFASSDGLDPPALL